MSSAFTGVVVADSSMSSAFTGSCCWGLGMSSAFTGSLLCAQACHLRLQDALVYYIPGE